MVKAKASAVWSLFACMMSSEMSSSLAANVVPIADFTDNRTATGMETVNDPVMGGTSHSTCTLDEGFLEWTGSVNIVPFLRQPGFCIVRTAGKQTFPDLETSSGIVFYLKDADSKLLLPLGGQVSTGARSRFGIQVYFEATLKQKDIDKNGTTAFYAKWEDFVPMMFGQVVKNGPKLDAHQLQKAYQIGLTTYPSHKAGDFRFEIVKIMAPTTGDTAGW